MVLVAAVVAVSVASDDATAQLQLIRAVEKRRQRKLRPLQRQVQRLPLSWNLRRRPPPPLPLSVPAWSWSSSVTVRDIEPGQ